MKRKMSTILEILIYSLNYILISYALSNVSILLKASPIFILFFASEIWVMGVYMNKIQEVTEKKGIILDTPCSMLCITYRYGVFHRENCGRYCSIVWIDNYYIVKDGKGYLVNNPVLPPVDM